METKLKKWGNSLGLRIPHVFVKELSLKNSSRVKMYIEENKLIIEPADEEHEYKLEDLLYQINEDNLHKEYNSGKPEGKEKW